MLRKGKAARLPLPYRLSGGMRVNWEPYLHKAQYYETDGMGIIHHSNYIRWFEEARVDFLAQIGMPFEEVEARGIVSPVLHVSCDYKTMAHFGETVRIFVTVTGYTGAKLFLTYRVEDAETGALRCAGESSHCFLSGGRPVSLRRAAPDYAAILRGLPLVGKED